jgi:hypothetical protein
MRWILVFLLLVAPARAQRAVLQLDDGYESHYTIAKPIAELHGHKVSLGVITGRIGHANRMTGLQLTELYLDGHEIQDHTVAHRPAFWCTGGAAAWEVYCDSSLAILAGLGITTRGWDSPGGEGQCFTPELRAVLVSRGYEYIAGAASLTNQEWVNFHAHRRDDPFRLGRYVFSWGRNAPGDAPAQAEVRSMIHRTAEGLAVGITPQPAWHKLSWADSSAWGFDSLCTWLEVNGISALRLEDALNWPDPAPGRELLPPTSLDRDADGYPDGWRFRRADHP